MDWRIRQLATTSSTNDDAKRAAETGEPEGFVVWALKQTAGRGRHGRRWESPEGNLYCSVLLHPKTNPESVGHYSFVAALALYDTVKEFLPSAVVTLKWPNDVLVDGRKISGILSEAGEGWLVLGMGLNVLHHPQDTLYPSTSFAANGLATKKLDLILDYLLDRSGYWYATLQTEGFLPVQAAWMTHAQKGALSVRLPTGEVHGEFAGLDDNGALRLRLADGSERAIATGDVFFGV
jgi:BirA family transcriptional regulator, biotin operon repressor / biotin---[acetyl-CoA-carboxylase] ligase